MIERMSTLWMVGLLAGALVLLGGPGQETSTEGAELARRPRAPAADPVELRLTELLSGVETTAGSPLEITGADFAYCGFNEDCPRTRVIRIGKSPMQFAVVTLVEDGLMGKEVEVTLEILSPKDATIFETGFRIPLRFKNQRSALLYKQQPDAIAKLQPGKYRYRATVMTSEGDHTVEWAQNVIAKK